MEHTQPRSKLKEQYTRKFVVSENEVPRTIGLPTYLGTVQPIKEVCITNLIVIGMGDLCDPMWGMLWMIQNTAVAVLPGRLPAQIQPTLV